MRIDLHVHTKQLSPCSDLDIEEAIREAKHLGLDGLCFTEHNRVREADVLRQLSEKWDFLLLQGIEVDTIEGHMLVYGLCRNFDEIIRAKELRRFVDEAGGIMVTAHPFKGFLTFGMSELKLTDEKASQRPVFQFVDAIEVLSGKLNESENDLALKVSEILNLKGTGGSDAHRLSDLGRCVTVFENKIATEQHLVAELKAGRFKAEYFNK
ncbi:MAG: PHP domain-containing protein [Chloroflexota bacterium]|nr:PHP domain-containing protein [Chloroflexota bacterium]